ncbi:hypothetical protein A1507_01710 [Methylomonas koyamae]|uniref:Uncharacterized protein n=1 Tax=Methylomonas koyamae TaxID=702114 RepID=A0A177N2M4_9GAMM|nr:hypothetical protein A1507_01710 [Methylomonas koyamae]
MESMQQKPHHATPPGWRGPVGAGKRRIESAPPRQTTKPSNFVGYATSQGRRFGPATAHRRGHVHQAPTARQAANFRDCGGESAVALQLPRQHRPEMWHADCSGKIEPEVGPAFIFQFNFKELPLRER